MTVLVFFLGFMTLCLFSLWRIAVYRERLTNAWAAYLKHDRDRVQASLDKALSLEDCDARDASLGGE